MVSVPYIAYSLGKKKECVRRPGRMLPGGVQPATSILSSQAIGATIGAGCVEASIGTLFAGELMVSTSHFFLISG